MGRTRPVFALSAKGVNWALKAWKVDTSHWTALGLSLLHVVGTVGTEKDLPAFHPALIVHNLVSGCDFR